MVGAAAAGTRLDAFLAAACDRFSRSRFKALIKQGRVAIGGRTIVEPNYRVNADERILIAMPEPDDPAPQAENIPITVVYEDDEVIVIDKPAGLVVHPAAGNWTGTLVNALIAHCGDSLSGIGGVRRPGIVHRLDKDTTGLMVVAKTDRAHRHLADQFADHGKSGDLERAYMALVWGAWRGRRGRSTRRLPAQAPTGSGARSLRMESARSLIGAGSSTLPPARRVPSKPH